MLSNFLLKADTRYFHDKNHELKNYLNYIRGCKLLHPFLFEFYEKENINYSYNCISAYTIFQTCKKYKHCKKHNRYFQYLPDA